MLTSINFLKLYLYLAIIQLKNRNAAAPYDIPAEASKVETDTSVEIWNKNFKKIRSQSVRKLHGKDNIAVNPWSGKVFNRVLLNRQKDAVDQHLRDHHAWLS